MAAVLDKFECSSCGMKYSKWQGKCRNCGEIDSIVEVEQTVAPTGGVIVTTESGIPTPITLLAEHVNSSVEKTSTGIPEFDRVLSGGLLPGEVVLLSGNAGAGKSTLLAQTGYNMAKLGLRVLYASAEENQSQILTRHLRVGAIHENLELSTPAPSLIDEVVGRMSDYGLVIVDSLQTFSARDNTSMPGSVSQVSEVARMLATAAKQMNVPTIIVGQVTKSDSIAGPKIVEHMVDAVLQFETFADSPVRLLRVLKNRFGDTEEVGTFVHSDTGIQSLSNPAEAFTVARANPIPGAATTVIQEGNRCLPLEVQALVNVTGNEHPRRQDSGINRARAAITVGVLEKYSQIPFGAADVYTQTVGGMRVDDPGVDLSVAVAVLTSYMQVPPPEKTVFVGEVTLTGELSPVSGMNKRIADAYSLGYEEIWIPERTKLSKKSDIKVTRVSSIGEVIGRLEKKGGKT